MKSGIEDEAEALRLLRAGHSAYKVASMVGRSYQFVRRIRDEHELPVQGKGVRPAVPSMQFVVDDPPECEGVGSGNPWMPPAGYDMYAERPNQRQWLAMLAAANRYEVVNLRHAICRVLGLPLGASDATIDDAVRADRRLAEELAGLYMAARAGKWAA